jgi:hypothetical protein
MGNAKKKQRKNKQRRRKSKKKKANAKWAKPTTSQGMNVPKEEIRGNSIMSRAQQLSEGVRREVCTD